MSIRFVDENTLTVLCLLLIAFALSSVIGLERARSLKSAGLRTHALVGLGSALFTLVSGYGFQGLLSTDVILDPSRIAAQIISGIGFLGAGVIFVRNDAVSGLTTAATIWLTAAVGMACGAGLPLVAAVTTAIHLFAVTAFGRIGRRIARQSDIPGATIVYKHGRGALRDILATSTALGYATTLERTDTVTAKNGTERVRAVIRFSGGPRDTNRLWHELSEVRGVVSLDTNADDED